MNAGGLSRPKLTSTIRSVPPASGTASGCSPFIARASSRECGNRTSMTVRLLYLRRRRPDPSKQCPRAEDQVLIRRGLQRRVTDATDTRDEQHAGGHGTPHDGALLPRPPP